MHNHGGSRWHPFAMIFYVFMLLSDSMTLKHFGKIWYCVKKLECFCTNSYDLSFFSIHLFCRASPAPRCPEEGLETLAQGSRKEKTWHNHGSPQWHLISILVYVFTYAESFYIISYFSQIWTILNDFELIDLSQGGSAPQTPNESASGLPGWTVGQISNMEVS